jgi:Fe-S-cluster containining protein
MAGDAPLRLQVIQKTCGDKCMGHRGNRGGCCKLGPRDWIIGPVRDAEAFVAQLSKHFGRAVARGEVLIDFEEGRRMFPERSMWQNPAHYPALRGAREAPYACQFYAEDRGCTVHELRPQLCRDYECDWLKGTLERVF